jgi:hypothetical protein
VKRKKVKKIEIAEEEVRGNKTMDNEQWTIDNEEKKKRQ